MLKLGEIITLNNKKKYAVVSFASYLDNKYCYLVDLDDFDNIKICLYDQNKLTNVLDENLLKNLENIFIDNIMYA